MRIKILLVGSDPHTELSEIQFLKDKNFLVYTCYNTDNINNLVGEIKPDVLFINPQKEDCILPSLYNIIIRKHQFIHIPVIYKLIDDGVFIINNKRNGESRGYIISDNLLDAVKIALHRDDHPKPRTYKINKAAISIPSYMGRA